MQDLRLSEADKTFSCLQDMDAMRRAGTLGHLFYNKVGVQEQYDEITVEEI